MAMSPLGEANRVVQLSTAASDFSWYAKSMLVAKGRPDDAAQFARAHHASPRLQQIFKSPVFPGSIEAGTWGAELAPFREAAEGFIASLPPYSAFDRILSDGGFTRMPLRTRVAIGSSAAIASSVSELAPKPISQMSFVQRTLPLWKAVGTLVINDELARSTLTSATDLFIGELRKAVAVATDAKFLEIVSQCTGATTNSSSGMSASEFLADVTTAARSLEVGVGSKLYLILPMDAWITASLLRDTGGMLITNGMIGNIRVVPTGAATDGVPVTDGVLLDATAIGADTDLAMPDVAREASIQMNDDPTAGSTNLVSLWQNDMVALRTERYFGAEVLRSTGVAVITGIGATT